MQENRTLDLNELLDFAAQNKVSDIHLTVGIKPAFRKDGVIRIYEQFEQLTPKILEEVVKTYLTEDKLKKLKNIGEVDSAFSRPGIGRYRINVFNQRGTYALAIRQQPFEIPQFETLGLPDGIKELAQLRKGLVLVTGVTGSGKSTTLASLIDIINRKRSCHIITIEDPIEYLHKHKSSIVNQREIGLDSLSYSNALKATLREDPDVILVGEMRDLETISTAITAAETGHLVFSTLHTMGASKTIDRIIDAFPPEQQNQVKNQLATVLSGVVCQQMIPRKDKPGVVVATEILKVTPAAQNLIREGKAHQLNSVIQTGAAHGMHTMDKCLTDLYQKGIISREEMMLRSSIKRI